MCKSIALLSGKGGSGKTTLALSMASMLSSCEIKVLLLDCDLCTNGATYFYEEKLNSKNNITSFYDMLINNHCEENFIEINTNYYFVPSITKITPQNIKAFYYNKNKDSFNIIYSRLCKNYDIIIFDCQAGYTDVLKTILPLTDVNLVVMEPDAISSSSIRSLLLKVGKTLNDKKVYQVFNKASTEEYETYSKISGGTVYTNIETIIFDWKIRKAFSVSQIPDMENVSAYYGQQIYSICKILFPNDYIIEKLKKFKYNIEISKNKEKEELIKKSIESLRREHRNDKLKGIKKITLYAFVFSFFVLLLFFLLNFAKIQSEYFYIVTSIMAGILALATSFISIIDAIKESKTYIDEINNLENDLRSTKLDTEEKKKELLLRSIQ